MKILIFLGGLATSHPIEGPYEKTCTVTCTGVSDNWAGYKSSDGYGVTTTGNAALNMLFQAYFQ